MKPRNFLVGLLVLACALRLIALTQHDMYTDEVLYSFRAIGNMDFDEAADQTTPLEWFDESRTQIPNSIPWWTHLSFHDHPPLFFWVEHFSIKAFGENPFAVRFPSVFFGILAIYAVYAIGKELNSEKLGLFAALLLAMTTNHLYISRLGLQESMLIALGLMGILAVLKAEHHTRQYYFVAFWFGLAFLTKYNAVLFMAIAGVILLARGVRLLPWKPLATATLLFLVIISPVIVYNAMLHHAVGHFDFQFSFIFKQHPDVWKVTPGKEIGDVFYRLQNFLPNVLGLNSPLFLLLAIAGVLSVFVKKNIKDSRMYIIGATLLASFYVIFLVGVSYRFLSMLTPFLALLGGYALLFIYEKTPKAVSISIISIIVIIEICYGLNSVAVAEPYGKPIFTYAEKVHSELEVTGYRELGKVLDKDLAGFRPSQVFEMRYWFLTAIHQQEIDKQIAKNLKPKSLIIAYDPNVQNLAQLWYFDRLNIYHAWPVVNIDQYAEYASRTKQPFPETNFKEHIFIIRAEGALSRRAESLNSTGAQTEAGFKQRGLKPEIIFAPNGMEAFHIYRFTSPS